MPTFDAISPRVFPPSPPEPSPYAALARAAGTFGPASCPVCGTVGLATGYTDNLRESGYCGGCRSWTRLRQLALVACRAVAEATAGDVTDLASVAGRPGFVIYNMQASGPIHDQLSRSPNYLCSEYFDGGMESGTLVGTTVHQDVMNLSYAEDSIDLVLSTDVFEHVADPYAGHAEVLRVLRPGGRHVFTVPFLEGSALDQVRATCTPSGEVVHHLPPEYHGDPIRPDGVLVFTIFGLEMLVRLGALGFDVRMHHVCSPVHGILEGGVVFEAVKSGGPPPPARRPWRTPVETARTTPLTVVVVTGGDEMATLRTLASVGRLPAGLDYDVVVVDDASADGTPRLLASLGGDVRIVRSPAPLGADEASRLGVEHARGERVVVLVAGEEADGAVLAELSRAGR